jgi:hypothetical protein
MKRAELRILLDKWYEALYSGQFKQGQGVYCRKNIETDECSYCCLGVLSHVAGIHPIGWKDDSPSNNTSQTAIYEGPKNETGGPQYGHPELNISPPPAVLGLHGTLGGTKSGGWWTINQSDLPPLYELNDSKNWTFSQIADHVKQHEEDYFNFED